MNDQENAVIVKNIYKTFKLPHEQQNGVKQLALGFLNRNKGFEVQKVLNNVSFKIKYGEFFGIVGRNGSGKSTLLKLLAGIYAPDEGLIQVNGALTPFIELGVGFNPELTGRENLYLNGALLGFDRDEMNSMYDEIVEFAEIDKFMDQKLKNYSSGMQVRLAFSIAIRANTPILLIDEVLAVGDSEFQKKCYAEFRKIKELGRTIIFVTHDMAAVERFCDRVLVLQKGKTLGVYDASEAAVIYEQMNINDGNTQPKKEFSNRWGTGKVTVNDVDISNTGGGGKKGVIQQGKPVELTVRFKKKLPKSQKITVGLAFQDTFGVNMSGPNSQKTILSSDRDVRFMIPNLPFVPGEYSLTIAVFDENSEEEYDHIEKQQVFTVVGGDTLQQHGKINLFGKWEQL